MPHTATQELTVSPRMVSRIINGDLFGDYAGLKIVVETETGDFYSIDVLDGITLPGIHSDEKMLLRKVDYKRIDAHDRTLVDSKGQYARFTFTPVPQFHFYSAQVDEGDVFTTKLHATTRALKPEMTLVIDWNKLVTLDALGV